MEICQVMLLLRSDVDLVTTTIMLLMLSSEQEVGVTSRKERSPR